MSSASVEEAQALTVPPLGGGIERDASFYFDDDPMAVFLVENTLFKVHRHFFIKSSQIFRDMFSIANTNQEGEADEKPISLPGVTRKEFQTLLRFFYSLPSRALDGGPMVIPGVTELTLDDKLSLLNISHRFLSDDIFHFITPQVQPPSIPIVERIRLGDKYNIAEWLRSAYIALLDRSPDDLSAEEAESLGFERVACLYRAKCFMYQERAEKEVGELPMDKETFWEGSLYRKPLPKKKIEPKFMFSPPSPGPAPVTASKSFTPTSEVVKKFFKLE